jgi:hypothetical protein
VFIGRGSKGQEQEETTGDGEDAKDCGPGWKYIHRGCYKFEMTNTKSWNDADLDCGLDGGELMSVSDMAELVR